MKRQAVMFDLDGTLADTLADIAAAGNHALRELGAAALPVERYRYLAGQGVRYLVREALGARDDDPRLPRGMALVEQYHAEHQHALAAPFPGIPDLLDALTEHRATLAVLSNKPDELTQQLVEQLFSRWRFDVVRGHRDGSPLKPDPAAAVEIAQALRIPPGQWVYVGDTSVDMQTGRSAGMTTVGVTWGFRKEAELREHGAHAIIHEPMELMECLMADV